MRLTGEQTGHSIGLGDMVRVKVVRVDVEEARVDLQFLTTGNKPTAAGKRGKETKKKAKRGRSKRK